MALAGNLRVYAALWTGHENAHLSNNDYELPQLR
jgi:hypothetical protein